MNGRLVLIGLAALAMPAAASATAPCHRMKGAKLHRCIARHEASTRANSTATKAPTAG